MERWPLRENGYQFGGFHRSYLAGIKPAPRRSLRSRGELKARSSGTCWSSTIPIRRANGSSESSWSACGSPER